MISNLSNSLSLSGLLRVVSRNTFGLDAFSLSVILFIITAEEINVVIIIISRSAGGGFDAASDESFACCAAPRKRVVLCSVGLDVVVPPSYMRLGRSIWSRCNGLENVYVCLRWSVS